MAQSHGTAQIRRMKKSINMNSPQRQQQAKHSYDNQVTDFSAKKEVSGETQLSMSLGATQKRLDIHHEGAPLQKIAFPGKSALKSCLTCTSKKFNVGRLVTP
jgi:hypothetical protein